VYQEEPAPPAYDDLTPRVSFTKADRFIWPAAGAISSYFGAGHPLGIDIALDPSVDSPVVASAAGTVVTAGGNACCGYGYYVEIEHEDGMSTLYGHFSKLQVSEGDYVEQGQVLGLGGSTGDADGKHVHFEVHEDGYVLDPLRFLPASQASQPAGFAACPDEQISADSDSSLVLDLAALVPDGYTASAVSVEALDAGYPDLDAEAGDGATVLVDVPLAPAATGKVYRFDLNGTFASGDGERTASCRIEVRTRQTLANSPETIAAYRAKFFTATATPSNTPQPTRTPYPTRTPRRTATPRPPATPTVDRRATKTPTPMPVTPTKTASRSGGVSAR
jgi:hypothetical protein